MNLKPFLASKNTTALGIAAFLMGLGQTVYFIADGDANTNPDFNTIFYPLVIALMGWFSRDANRSSQDSGIRS